MDKDDIIEQLQEAILQLEHDNELLRAHIGELEAQLAKYENPHTPPSLRRGGNAKNNQKKNGRKKPGQKKGHKGVTRKRVEPDDRIDLTLDQCPYCNAELDSPSRVESKVIEEIPEPQPVIVTEYKITHYTCPRCKREIIATDPGCPKEGIFGNNTIAQATVLKYEERLPHRKIRGVLNRQYGLDISPATIFDLTRRPSDAVRSEYIEIIGQIILVLILMVMGWVIHRSRTILQDIYQPAEIIILL